LISYNQRIDNKTDPAKGKLIKYFFFFSFAFLLYQLFLLMQPFLTAILGSLVLALAFYPVYFQLRKIIKSPALASLIMTLAVIVVAVIPLIWGVRFLLREADWLFPANQNIMANLRGGNLQDLETTLPPAVQSLLDTISARIGPEGFDIKPILLDNLRVILTYLTQWGTLVAKHAFISLLNFIILLISLFFMFKDGDATLKWILSLIPMQTEHKEILARRAYETFRAVTIGVSLTAAAQGFAAFLGFVAVGVHIPFLLGVATFMCSLLGASFIVTVPVCLFVLKTSTVKGVLLLAWSLGVVGFLDNLLKPVLIGSKARMPFILVFFSIIGGIKHYGLLGLILGPVLVASVLTFIKIYRETYTTEKIG